MVQRAVYRVGWYLSMGSAPFKGSTPFKHVSLYRSIVANIFLVTILFIRKTENFLSVVANEKFFCVQCRLYCPINNFINNSNITLKILLLSATHRNKRFYWQKYFLKYTIEYIPKNQCPCQKNATFESVWPSCENSSVF